MKYLSFLIILLLLLISCEPQLAEKSELGPRPTPSFEIVQDSTPNDFILRNTTEGAFMTKWDLGDAGIAEGEEVSVNFIFAGDYEISMTTFTRGGSATTSQTLTVTQDDPSACKGDLELLTACGEKVWVLAPEAAALHIGPSLNETWWSNSSTDVSGRECHFNDEYIFRSNGEFEYDNKGDFWADTDGNGDVTPPDLGVAGGACHPSTAWPEAYKAWDSGVYSFSLTPNSLTVIGEGAWIGLYKAGTTEEVVTPQQSVTYSISELTEDRMVIFADYGWGVWRFTLVPKQ